MFSKTFKKSQQFAFEADGVKSKAYAIQVLPKPIVLNFNTEIDYPAYTGRKDETLNNTGDLIIPEGTCVTWNIFTRDTDKVTIAFKDSSQTVHSEKANQFTHKQCLEIVKLIP